MTHRFFIPTDWFEGDRVTLRGPLVHQIRDVLRLTPGDTVVVLDDSGWEYEVQLDAVEQEQAAGRIQNKVLARTEPRAKITLYQSLLKGRQVRMGAAKRHRAGHCRVRADCLRPLRDRQRR